MVIYFILHWCKKALDQFFSTKVPRVTRGPQQNSKGASRWLKMTSNKIIQDISHSQTKLFSLRKQDSYGLGKQGCIR